MENKRYLTVSALNRYLESKFNNDFNLRKIYLKGEISNLRLSKGIYYFQLKDETSEISAIIFSSVHSKLDYKLSDGMNVFVEGKVNLYYPRGTYSINIEKIYNSGLGESFLNFQKLKDKLGKEGLFDNAHKKEIPPFCNNIGVVTSETSDAFQDVKSTIEKRFPLSTVFLYPSLVQGPDAPSSLIKSLQKADQNKNLDVIIICRGGGSSEDLSCFNDENLARVIYSLNTPIVSGVGHETDFTICDFVSDFRAPTPTGAAVKVTNDKKVLYQEVLSIENNIISKIKKILTDKYNSYNMLISSYKFKCFDEVIDLMINNLASLSYSLVLNSPKGVIEREEKTVLSLIKRLELFDFNKRIDNNLNEVNIKEENITKQINLFIKNNVIYLDTLIDKLITINPLNLMKKGYTLSFQDDKLLLSKKDIDYNKDIKLKFHDGEVITMPRK